MNTKLKKALYESIMKNVSKQVKKVLNESNVETIYVADVYYNDDDGYNVHVTRRINPTDTEEDVENALYEEGMVDVYVEDIYTKEVPAGTYRLYDVVDVFDDVDNDEDDDEYEDDEW